MPPSRKTSPSPSLETPSLEIPSLEISLKPARILPMISSRRNTGKERTMHTFVVAAAFIAMIALPAFVSMYAVRDHNHDSF